MMQKRMGGSEVRRRRRGLEERMEEKRTEEWEGMVRGKKEAKRKDKILGGRGKKREASSPSY
jgi:hypothetical protein